jgi:UDP-N-acetylmuramate--alanine ligase
MPVPRDPRQPRPQLHFVGIGGIGMSGIAEVFLNQGYPVSGSDLAESDTTRRLAELGARIRVGHDAGHVHGAQVLVISSAVRPSNPEVLEARRLRIPVIPRAEALGELMRGKTGIAIAGSHGKTTTTSMLATILTHARLDPTLVIGGKVDLLGGNAKLGAGEYVVAEADESDGSFLHLPATYGVITNVDNDHLDHFGDQVAIDRAFAQFVGKLPFYGLAAVCGDDPGVRRCLPEFHKPVTTYGFGTDNDWQARALRVERLGSRYDVWVRSAPDAEPVRAGEIALQVPGRHNALNSLAAVVIAARLGVELPCIAEALAGYRGVKRRFEIRWQDNERRQAIVDDYGHHPTEVAATLAAARQFWPGRVTVVFQPHRYSRTVHCESGFLDAFSGADRVLMTDIYAAGEDPLPGVSAESLCSKIRARHPSLAIEAVGSLERARERVAADFREGDLVLCLGAGSITRLPDQLIAARSKETVTA